LGTLILKRDARVGVLQSKEPTIAKHGGIPESFSWKTKSGKSLSDDWHVGGSRHERWKKNASRRGRASVLGG